MSSRSSSSSSSSGRILELEKARDRLEELGYHELAARLKDIAERCGLEETVAAVNEQLDELEDD